MNYNVNYRNIALNLMPHFLRDLDFDVEDGDLAIDDSVEQDVFFILQADKGNFYFAPTIGYGIFKKLNSSIDKAVEKRQIRDNLEQDGISVQGINIITYNDAIQAGVNDVELLRKLKQDKFIISIEASR